MIGKEQILNALNLARKTVPTMHEIADLQPTGMFSGIRAVWFEGMEQGGNKTKVFAYFGMPAGASSAAPVPAVVLLHGGGGHAFLTWVKKWNDAGYAALAIDHTGYFPLSVNAGVDESKGGVGTWDRTRLPAVLWEEGYVNSPDKDDMSSSAGPLYDMWMYHAVGQAILGANALRADARVATELVGVVGISWGGVIASIAIGYESRFAFAVPIYGSGYLDEAMSWMKEHFSSEETKALWLAQSRFHCVRMPILWLCWNDDCCFSVNSNSKSYLDTVKSHANTRISMVSGMKHSHTAAWIRPESYRFADWIVKGGAAMTELLVQPSFEERRLALALRVDPSATRITAKLYYITSPMTYSYHNKHGMASTFMDQIWETADLTVNGTQVTGTVPAQACGYYIEITTTVEQGEYVICSPYIEPTGGDFCTEYEGG